MQRFLQHARRDRRLLICTVFLAGLFIMFSVGTSSFSRAHDLIWLKNQVIQEVNNRLRASASDPGAVMGRNHTTTSACMGLACVPPASLAAANSDGSTDASIASRFRARLDRVREACEPYHGPAISPTHLFRYLYVSEKYNLMVCVTPKVSVLYGVNKHYCAMARRKQEGGGHNIKHLCFMASGIQVCRRVVVVVGFHWC